MSKVSMKDTALRPGDVVYIEATVFVCQPGNFLESTFLALRAGPALSFGEVKLGPVVSRAFKPGDRVRFGDRFCRETGEVMATFGKQLWVKPDSRDKPETVRADSCTREAEKE